MGEVTLQILPVTPAGFCMPWHARLAIEEPVFGGVCCWCGRDIVVPTKHRGVHMACIYCGLDRGALPAVEIEPGHWADVILADEEARRAQEGKTDG